MRWRRALPVLLLAGFALIASWGTSTRGIIAEEVAPYLRRHTVVLEGGPCAAPRPQPPYEPDAPAGPRLFATSSWPIVAYDGRERMWPILIRAYQSAIASYVGIGLGPLLGGGIAGVRRSTIVLGVLIIALTTMLARRSGRAQAVWVAALLATSFGMIASARTGYAFELGSRAAMMASLAVLGPRAPPGPGRACAAGLLAALAIASRATIAAALLPALVVMLCRKERRAGIASPVLALSVAVLTPVAALSTIAHLVALRTGTGPFATFVASGLGARLLAVPGVALLDLAWLGDSTAVWGPLYAGARSMGPGLWAAAAPAAVVAAAALVRARRGTAGEGERMFLAAAASSVVGAALLYRSDNQFQLALPLEPLFAMAAAEQIVALRTPPRPTVAWILGALAIVLRVQGTARGMLLDAHPENPMLSGATQRGVAERLMELGARGSDVVTTTYDHAGVIEAWTSERLRPVHAWPLFISRDEASMRNAWQWVLATYHPRYVVLTVGSSLVESGGTDVRAIERALDEVATEAGLTIHTSAVPTEGGTPGWAIAALEGTMSPMRPPQGGDCNARDGVSVPSLAGIRPGDRVGECDVRGIDRTPEGAGRFRLACPGGPVNLYAMRGGSYSIAPGHGAGWGITYRNDERGEDTPEHLASLAAALGDLLDARGRAP